MNHPPNVMPEELQRAHYIMQIVTLERVNTELLSALKDLHFAVKHNLPFQLEPAEAAIAKAESNQ